MAPAAAAPASAARAASSRKFPRVSVARTPNRARRCPARRSASGSRSIPSRRAPGPPASRSRSACPPIPIVPSTSQPPRWGRKRNVTSSTRTGRCACSSRPPASDTLERQPRADLVERAAVARAPEVRPALRVPYLEHLLHADDQHLFHEAGALAIIGRDLDASLQVEHHVLAEGEVAVAELLRVGIEARQRRHPRLELFPRLQRIHIEPLGAVGHDHELVAPAIGQRLPEPGRDAEPTLRVDRVPVMSPKQLPSKGGKAPYLEYHLTPLHGNSSHSMGI